MSAPKIIVGDESRGGRTAVMEAADRAAMVWGMLWWVGGFLFVAGLVDLGLALYPPGFGNPVWRFAAFGSIANGLPLPAVGILTATMAALASNRTGRARFAMIVNAILAVALVGLLIGFLTAVGTAFAEAPANVHEGLSKGVIKTVLFTVIFGLASGAAAVIVARWLRTFGE